MEHQNDTPGQNKPCVHEWKNVNPSLESHLVFDLLRPRSQWDVEQNRNSVSASHTVCLLRSCHARLIGFYIGKRINDNSTQHKNDSENMNDR
jgi:hypothetical protein